MAIEETSNFLATPHPNFAQFHCEEFQDHCILQVHFSPVVLVFAQIDGPRLQKMQGKSVLTSWIGSGLRFGVFSKGQRGKDHLHDFDIGSDQILEVLRHILGQSSPVILKGTPWPSWITYVLHRVAHGVTYPMSNDHQFWHHGKTYGRTAVCVCVWSFQAESVECMSWDLFSVLFCKVTQHLLDLICVRRSQTWPGKPNLASVLYFSMFPKHVIAALHCLHCFEMFWNCRREPDAPYAPDAAMCHDSLITICWSCFKWFPHCDQCLSMAVCFVCFELRLTSFKPTRFTLIHQSLMLVTHVSHSC